MNGDKRYHAEVKVTLEGRECRINAFRDTLQEVFQDIGTICSQFPQDWMNPAKREIVNAERKAAGIRQQQADAKLKPAAREAALNAPPICRECGTAESMELIEFPDKVTGQLRKAWKCQACTAWYWPNAKNA